jgi:hypothetical protein
MMATRKMASRGGKNITRIGIISVEVPNPVMVPTVAATNVRSAI